MVETTYTKSISADFGGNINTSQLQQEIDTSNISTTINRIDTTGDAVYIVFDNALSGGDQTTLNNVISAHVPHSVYTSVIPIYSTDKAVAYSAYTNIVNFSYNIDIPVRKIEIISHINTNASSYDIRILNMTQNSVMKTVNKTNTVQTITAISTFDNLPTVDSLVGIQIKAIGGNRSIMVHLITLFF